MFQPVIRTLSLLEQWSSEVIRQPALMFSLVVAPFLLLLAFGEGASIGGPRPQTLIVQPPGTEEEVSALLARIEQSVDIVGTTDSLPIARRALERGDVDAVIIVPEDPEGLIEAGEQIPIHVLIGEIDPLRRSYARGYLRDQVSTLNQQAVTEVIREAQQELGQVNALTADAREYVQFLGDARGDMEEARAQIAEFRGTLDVLSSTVTSINGRTGSLVFAIPGLAGVRQDMQELQTNLTEMQATVDEFDRRLQTNGEGGMPTDAELQELEESLTLIDNAVGDLSSIPAEVMTTPFVLEMEDITPVEPTFTVFYSPGVVALLAQHLAITLGALTMARMRLLRITDMLRVAPVRAVEVVIGSYISYALLCGIAVTALIAAVRFGLDVPVVGSYLLVAAAVALLILCSLGVGFVISLLASSVQQAVQVSMLVLLGSIFFSGFVFSLDQISWPVRAISHVLPATYGIRTLQDLMLRGLLRHPEDLLVLGGAALVLFVLAALLMKKEFRPD